jgi:hypothetical protein
MQRDLFLADIHPFPLDRTAEVRQMAKFLSVVHGEAAQKYYIKRIAELAKRMRTAGVSYADAKREVAAFQEAVQIELQRLHEARSA